MAARSLLGLVILRCVKNLPDKLATSCSMKLPLLLWHPRFCSDNCLCNNLTSLCYFSVALLCEGIDNQPLAFYSFAYCKAVTCLMATLPYLFWAPIPNKNRTLLLDNSFFYQHHRGFEVTLTNMQSDF